MFALFDDQHADDDVWHALANGQKVRVPLEVELRDAFVCLSTTSARLRQDGYLRAETAARYARPAVLELLCQPVLGGPAVLHRRGDTCACLGQEWTDGFDLRIHGFLKRNPSKAEQARNRAQKADRRDDRLKREVYERDGGCCRFCRSGPLILRAVRAKDRRKVLQYDNVDPDAPAGADGSNFVVACAACNEYKGHRTPDEADVVLLPEPTQE